MGETMGEGSSGGFPGRFDEGYLLRESIGSEYGTEGGSSGEISEGGFPGS